MKPNGTNTEAPDEIVSTAIAYLDSPTDYREFIRRIEQPRVTRRRRNRRRQSQEESLWLLLVPVSIIIIAVIVLIARLTLPAVEIGSGTAKLRILLAC